jgi:hypothetical protein
MTKKVIENKKDNNNRVIIDTKNPPYWSIVKVYHVFL